MPSLPYVHGYSPRESVRLADQAQTLSELLHHDEIHPPGSLILEAGCGTGAQTVILARNNPKARLVSVDCSPESLELARRAAAAADLANVRFEIADILRLPFPDATFDVVFVCFVLEHLADPPAALAELKRVLRPGGTITVIEGDHGSAHFHPDSGSARKAIQCLIDLQKEGGGFIRCSPRRASMTCGCRRGRFTPTPPARRWSRASPATRSRPWWRASNMRSCAGV